MNGDVCSPLQFNLLVCNCKAEQRKRRPECDKSGKKSVILVRSDPISQLSLDSDHSVDFTLFTNKNTDRVHLVALYVTLFCNMIVNIKHIQSIGTSESLLLLSLYYCCSYQYLI